MAKKWQYGVRRLETQSSEAFLTDLIIWVISYGMNNRCTCPGFRSCVRRDKWVVCDVTAEQKVKDALQTPPVSSWAAPGLWSPQTRTSDNCVWFLKADKWSFNQIFKSAHIIARARTHSWKPQRSGTSSAGCNWPAWTFPLWRRLQIPLYPEEHKTTTWSNCISSGLSCWEKILLRITFLIVSSPVFCYICNWNWNIWFTEKSASVDDFNQSINQ